MTVARQEHESNVVLGAGEVYIDVLDGDDLQGERYLGDSVGATLSLTTERTTIQSGDGQVARDLVDIVRSVSRTIGFTVRDMSIENWALFLIGVTDDEAVAASAGTTNLGTVKKDRWYQLGRSASNPSGVGAVGAAADVAAAGKTSVMASTTSGGAAAATVQAANWELDEKAGRIKFLKDLYRVVVAHTPKEARTVNQAKVDANTKQIVCALRYIEDAASGMSRNVYVRKCTLVPAGEMQLKSRDTEQQMAFTATVAASPDAYPDITIDDLPIESGG